MKGAPIVIGVKRKIRKKKDEIIKGSKRS